MISLTELAIVKFKQKYHEKIGSFILPDEALRHTINDLDHTQTIAEVVALPLHTGDFPSTLCVGDKVRCEYGAMDDKSPLEKTDDGVLYHVHLEEILYKINEDGSPTMQHGWVLGRGLPIEKPDWAAGTQTIHGIVYWTNKFGHCMEKVDFSGQLNKMKVYGIGKVKPSLGKLEFKIGDTVTMMKECEFTNHGNNEILGKRYWFVRQEEITGVIWE
jgi:hypothetical protein